MSQNKFKYSLSILIVVFLSSCYGLNQSLEEEIEPAFNGQSAFEDVAYQVSLGPRFPGSEGHRQVRSWIVKELLEYGWEVEVQTGDHFGKLIYNIIAYRHDNSDPEKTWIILGAHYDTRMISDQDPDPALRSEPVIGANDGASGVAVLLEFARILPTISDSDVWLVFFDAEDNGGVSGWEWVVGSSYFVRNLTEKPDKVVILDMVGDADQNIFMEKSSDPELAAEIWQSAQELEISTFIPESKFRILDDHTPFLEEGITAIDLIDFSYPYWHTTQDTLDKVSAQSLQNIGDVLLHWLIQDEETAP